MAGALALVTFALTLIGLVAICSVTSMEAVAEGALFSSEFRNQALFALAGAIVGYLVYRFVPVRAWSGKLCWALWAVAIALLAATAIFGTEALGAKRWLSIGQLSFQPSEFVKVALVVMAAKVAEEQRRGRLAPLAMWAALGLRVGIPAAAMLYAQSDLGTTMVCLAGVVAMLWLCGIPARHVLAFCAGCLALAAVAVLASPYRFERLLVTFDPWADGQGGLGGGYQLIHSLYALATGGIGGVGIGGSSEKYGSLPEADTDFIFAVIGEECGILGATAVIALFVVYLWAGMHVSENAASSYGSSLSGALTVTIVFQAFLNVASVIGVFPMTGKPLPFVSYGGTSLIMSLVMTGLIASAIREEPPPDREDRESRRRAAATRRARPTTPRSRRESRESHFNRLLAGISSTCSVHNEGEVRRFAGFALRSKGGRHGEL